MGGTLDSLQQKNNIPAELLIAMSSVIPRPRMEHFPSPLEADGIFPTGIISHRTIGVWETASLHCSDRRSIAEKVREQSNLNSMDMSAIASWTAWETGTPFRSRDSQCKEANRRRSERSLVTVT